MNKALTTYQLLNLSLFVYPFFFLIVMLARRPNSHPFLSSIHQYLGTSYSPISQHSSRLQGHHDFYLCLCFYISKFYSQCTFGGLERKSLIIQRINDLPLYGRPSSFFHLEITSGNFCQESSARCQATCVTRRVVFLREEYVTLDPFMFQNIRGWQGW